MLEFSLPIDCIAICDSNIIVGLSELQGDVWDGSVVVIDKNSGEVIQNRRFSSGIPRLVTCSIGLKSHIVSGRDDGTIELLDMTLDNVFGVDAHDSIISALSASPDSDYLVSGAYDGSLALWSLQDSSIPISLASRTYNGHNNKIADVDYHPTEKYFASCGVDRFCRLWDVRTNLNHGCCQIINIDQMGCCAHWCQWSPYSLLVGCADGSITCYDIRMGSSSSHLSNELCNRTFDAHKSSVSCIKTAISRPGLIISCSCDGSVASWNSHTPHDSLVLRHRCVCFPYF